MLEAHAQAESLPEFYITTVTDDNGQMRQHQERRPLYKIMADCHMIYTGPETGVDGPCLVLEGSVIISEEVPNGAMLPLNRAAGERVQAWHDSLPTNTHGITLEDVIEAVRKIPEPQAGENSQDRSLILMRKAAEIADDRRKVLRRTASSGAIGFKPIGSQGATMPFTSSSLSAPGDVGRAPANAAQINNPRAAKPVAARRQQQTPMPGLDSAPGA